MRKIKFALLTQHWLSAKGGVTTRFYNLMNGLGKRDVFTLAIVTPDPYNDKNIFNVYGKNKNLLFITTFLTLFRLSPDIIHCAEHGYMLLAAVLYKFFKPKVKILFSFHTDRGVEFKNHIQNIFLNWSMNKCDYILSTSVYLFNEMVKERKLNIKTAVRVFPSAVIIKEFNESQVVDAKNRLGLNGSYPILATIGVFEWSWKIEGMKLLLSAFAKMSLSGGKVIIIGDGKYRKELEEFIATLSIADKVVITGYVENPYPLLAISDIYCHFALNEAFGNAILEAMVMEKPVIVARKGGMPEIVRDGINGLIVEPTVSEIARAITTLLNDPDLRKKLAHNAKFTATNEYNMEKCIDKYLDIVAEALGCKREALGNGVT